jgi:hypothetical protein
MTAAAKLEALADSLRARRDELQSKLEAAQAVLDAPIPESFDEQAAVRRAAVALAHDAATGETTLAAVKAAINAERQAVERSRAADTQARAEAQKVLARAGADVLELAAQLAETDKLVRLEVQRLARDLPDPRQAFVAHLVGLVDALARQSAIVALSNDASDIEPSRTVQGFEITLPVPDSRLLDGANLPGAWLGRANAVHVDRYEGARLASEAYQSLRRQLIEG